MGGWIGLKFLELAWFTWRLSYELWYLHLSLTLRMGARAYGEEMDKKNRKCFFDHLGGGIGLKFLVVAQFTMGNLP